MTGLAKPASASWVRSGPSSRSGTLGKVTENGHIDLKPYLDDVATRSYVSHRYREACYGGATAYPYRRRRTSAFLRLSARGQSVCGGLNRVVHPCRRELGTMFATIRRY